LESLSACCATAAGESGRFCCFGHQGSLLFNWTPEPRAIAFWPASKIVHFVYTHHTRALPSANLQTVCTVLLVGARHLAESGTNSEHVEPAQEVT
jgi:hypothetical protein